jgi:hypothetical protein
MWWMRWLRGIALNVAREVYGLFVDDVSYAVAVLVWVACCVIGLPLLLVSRPAAGQWGGPMLFSGLAAVLTASALRTARRGR